MIMFAKRAAPFLLAVLLVVLGGPAAAQVPNYVNVVAYGATGFIIISVQMDIGGELPGEWVGWVLDRVTDGECTDPIQIGPQRVFPVGEQQYSIFDYATEPDVTYGYRVYAVDAAGTRIYLPGYTLFPPAYYHTGYAAEGGVGIIGEGILTGDPGWYIFDGCDENCWWSFSIFGDLPVELQPYLDTGQAIRLYGTITDEFEGPFADSITGWTLIDACTPVPNMPTTWDQVKSWYR